MAPLVADPAFEMRISTPPKFQMAASIIFSALPRSVISQAMDASQGVKCFFASSSRFTSLSTIKFYEKNPEFVSAYIFSGGFILFLYLAGKMEKNKLLFAIKTVINKNSSPKSLKYEPHLIGLVVVLYAFSFSLPIIFNNPLNTWFMNSIENIYKTPLLGSIISFVGFIFLIIMLVKGTQTVKKYWLTLIAYISGKPIPNKSANNDFMNQLKNMQNTNIIEDNIELDDVYVDFEEIKDDED